MTACVLRAGAAAEVGGNGKQPATEPSPVLELLKRGERTQKRLLGQLECSISIAIAGQQAESHHPSVVPIEQGMLRRAVSAGSAAHQVRFLGFAGGRTDHLRFLNMGSPMSPKRRLPDAILIAFFSRARTKQRVKARRCVPALSCRSSSRCRADRGCFQY